MPGLGVCGRSGGFQNTRECVVYWYSIVVRVGREEEGVSSLRAELAAMARALQADPAESDLIYLCDSEAALNKISRWIGSGPRTTLAGDANADIIS